MSINYDYVGRSQRANHYTMPPRVAIHCASWYFLQRTFLRLNPRSRHPSDSGRETWVLRRRACGRPVCWWGIQLLRTCIRVEWGFEYDDRDKRGTSLDVRPERTIDSPIWCIYNIIQLTPTHATSFTHTGRGYACPIFGDGVSYPTFQKTRNTFCGTRYLSHWYTLRYVVTTQNDVIASLRTSWLVATSCELQKVNLSKCWHIYVQHPRCIQVG